MGWFRTQPATNLGGNGVVGVRPHPPWPPLIKGGKGHGGRDGFFHGERCRGRAASPPLWPPERSCRLLRLFPRGTVSGACVPTPGPRKGHAACYGFFHGDGVVGVRPHPWPPERSCRLLRLFPRGTVSGACVPTPLAPGKVMPSATAFSTGNGVGGVRPPSGSPAFAYAGSTPPNPPFARGGRPGRSPPLRNKDGRNARVMQCQLFTGPGRAECQCRPGTTAIFGAQLNGPHLAESSQLGGRFSAISLVNYGVCDFIML